MVRKSRKTFSRAALAILLTILLVACAAPNRDRPLAHFDGNNTQVIALTPYYLPDPQEQRGDHAWQLTLKVSDGKPYFGLIKAHSLLIDPLIAYVTQLHLQPGQTAGVPEAQHQTGCRGQTTVQLAIAATGALSGNLDYENYTDNCGLTYDAALTVTGQLDTATGQMELNLNYARLPAQLEQRRFLLSGQLQLTMNAYQGKQQRYLVHCSMLIDEVNQRQVQLTDGLLSWDLTGRYPAFSITGTVDIPEFGTAGIVTDSPLLSYAKDSPPFDGVLIFNGAEASWRRLYFPKSTDPGAFRIDGSNGMRTMGKF